MGHCSGVFARSFQRVIDECKNELAIKLQRETKLFFEKDRHIENS